MPDYLPDPAEADATASAEVGVLLVNLGTPDEPTPSALRRYLREFLWDPRVVEEPRLKWWLILNLIVLTFRPRKAAALYRKIWMEGGSPLLLYSRSLAEGVERELRERLADPISVEVAMRYGNPSIAGAIERLKRRGCRRLLCLPLYPQYSGATTGSTFDGLVQELVRWRVVPEVRTVHEYHVEPAYLDAVAASIREGWEGGRPPGRLVFSFHGLPQRYADEGDPYPQQCRATALGIVERLGLPDDGWTLAFQSRFGSDPWLEPATDVTLYGLAEQGIDMQVVCPGFATDCLETLEEIGQLDEDCRERHGRGFRYVPCLNDDPRHARALAGVIRRGLEGWVEDRRPASNRAS